MGLDYSGIRFYKGTLTELLSEYQPVILDQNGKQLRREFSKDQSFLIGDQVGYPSGYEKFFNELERISLGSVEYLSSQTINILNFKLDQEENLLVTSTQ